MVHRSIRICIERDATPHGMRFPRDDVRVRNISASNSAIFPWIVSAMMNVYICMYVCMMIRIQNIGLFEYTCIYIYIYIYTVQVERLIEV